MERRKQITIRMSEQDYEYLWKRILATGKSQQDYIYQSIFGGGVEDIDSKSQLAEELYTLCGFEAEAYDKDKFIANFLNVFSGFAVVPQKKILL